MLIHGARAALAGRSRGDTPLGARWRAHGNVAVVAVAAKLARIAWAVLRSGADWPGSHRGQGHPPRYRLRWVRFRP